MKDKVAKILGWVFLLSVIGGAAWAVGAMNAARARERNLRVKIANDSAALDATVFAIRKEASDSSFAVARRLAFQTEVKLREAFTADSLELEGKVSARIAIAADSIDRIVRGEAAEVDSAGTVTVTGELDATDSLGVKVTATVEIHREQLPLWRWNIWRAAVPLELALSCRGDLAVAQLAGPAWATLTIDSVAQDETICIPPPPRAWRPFELDLPSLPAIVLLVGSGILAGLSIR